MDREILENRKNEVHVGLFSSSGSERHLPCKAKRKAQLCRNALESEGYIVLGYDRDRQINTKHPSDM